MKLVDDAIEAGYAGNITELYEVFSQSVFVADGRDAEILAAQDRFRRGLEVAARVRTLARTAAGL